MVDTDLLRNELERALGAAGHAPARIRHLERRASRYCTSFALEELEVSLADGRQLDIIWKDLGRHSLNEAARRVKPEFLHNPAREIQVYRQILAAHPLGTATFYGAVLRAEPERCWLFVERVRGRELYQVGEFQVWLFVARWLAGMHVQFRAQAGLFQAQAPLLVHDPAYYRQWMTRARQFAAGTKSAVQIEWLAERHERVVERLVSLHPTLLHGEFYASNILVAPLTDSLRVCPVDWEMAAIGPGLMDLGALVSGAWSTEQRRELASAYYSALPAPRELPWEELLEALDYCRLQIAVQWLGWSPAWSPPPEHAHDWRRQAALLAERLDF